MNKKRLMALPVVCVVVAMLGASVMAAGSASKAFKVLDEDQNDITVDYEGIEISSTFDLSTLDGLQDKVTAVNKEAKVEDAQLVAAYDITETKAHSGDKTVIFTGVESKAGDVFVVVHDGKEYEVGTSAQITVSDFSPFLVYKISVTSSAQTGEYAAPYIVMISVALVACGAIFAVRAKKATK